MLYEYALEPALLSNWTAFRYFTEKFSFSEGRLISRFPKRWKEEVHTLLSKCDVRECSEIQLKRVEELLFGENSDGRTFDDRMLVRRHEWNPGKDWLTNAENEHEERPFHAILAKENPRGKDFVLEGDNVEDATSLFRVEKMPSVPRSADEITNLIGPVLRYAKEILLIDPHFRPRKPEYQDMMGALLAAAVRECTAPHPRVEFHTSDKLGTECFSDEARKHLPRLIPEGMKVRLVRWSDSSSDERFHNRFILTDRGGLKFGDGLDEGKGRDQVSRFGKESETYFYLRKLYEKDSSTLGFIDEIEIIGEAMPSQ